MSSDRSRVSGRRALPAVLLVVAFLLASPLAAQGANAIVLENQREGTTDWLITSPAANREIEGYASRTSVNRGSSVDLYVSTDESDFAVEVFRLGWYNGAGGRRLYGPVWSPGLRQPTPPPHPVTGLIECRWLKSLTLDLPATTDRSRWVSGIYVVKLTAGQSGAQSYIPLVVRDDERASDLLFQASVTTWQAYNNWGGKSLYDFNSIGGHAVEVSFDRPYAEGDGSGHLVWPWGGWELNMLRFLEREGFDVSYLTNIDVDAAGATLLPRHRAFLSVGHDEYWTWDMRSNVERARDKGVSVGFFGANICYWQIRLEPARDPRGRRAPRRVIVAYKYDYQSDPYYTDAFPENDHLVTTQWRLPPVNRPEDALIGVAYIYDPVDADIVVENTSHWAFAGTGMQDGDRLEGLLGYEVDAMLGHAPANTVRLGHSPFLDDDGNTLHSDMTVYTAPGGAVVFATGSIQWSWGLDDLFGGIHHPVRVNAQAQQITRNVLARMTGP